MNMHFERSTTTDTIVVALRGINGEVGYGSLAKQTGITVPRLKACLASARRILRREKILFGTVRGQGLRRLGDDDKVRKSEDNKKRMARTAGRAIKELDTIEAFDRLSNVDQIVVTTNRTIFNLAKAQLQANPRKSPSPAAPPEMSTVEKLVRLAK